MANTYFTDEEIKQATDKLKQINGRVTGLSEMFESGRTPEEILMQILSIHESLRMVARLAIQSYLKQASAAGLNAINKKKQATAYQDALDILYRYIK